MRVVHFEKKTPEWPLMSLLLLLQFKLPFTKGANRATFFTGWKKVQPSGVGPLTWWGPEFLTRLTRPLGGPAGSASSLFKVKYVVRVNQ